MIVQREKYYIKVVNKDFISHCTQKRKQTSFWLFGIIPLYIKDEFLSGDYEY